VAKDLAEVNVKGRTIEISLTEQGKRVAKTLAKDEAFVDLNRRANLLKTHFDIKGTRLMKFIYETFPEIASMRSGEEIGK